MAALLSMFAMLFLSLPEGRSQSADDFNEGCLLIHDALNDDHAFSWWGREGRTYFIQHSEDLIQWFYVPLIESGDSHVISWFFESTAPRFFLRLKHTDIPVDDPGTADFDGDGVTNATELALETDPFLKTDTDGDGLFDDWETAHGLDPAVQDTNQNGTPDGSEDSDGDTLSNLDEQSVGGDPAVNQWTTQPPQIEYNDAGQLTLFTAPGGAATGFAQDSEGNVKTTP
jgi:YD repeat-containing protein